ncbi:hypothetical protein BJV78DRAFT_295539 [Lactifluus subvellereus]|nr:hypothetical protein BJV78DRAFT_295539 [Lactifluus subvellereus]
MEHSALFLKLRLAVFSLTTLICLIWVILLSCVLFLRWDVSSLSERSFLLLFLGIDTLTTIMLPVLLLVKFRTWLDGARLLLLLIFHIGIAASFVVWNPTIPCPDDTPDDQGVCQLLNVYILIASWVPPSLLILYGVGLSSYTWRYACQLRRPLSAIEGTRGVRSSLWGSPGFSGHLSYLEDPLPTSPDTGGLDSHRESRRKSRLEKRLPEHVI